MRHWFPLGVLFAVMSCQNVTCPSSAGGRCNPRNPGCPAQYVCALAEVCTRTCEQSSDCWVKVEDGCYYNEIPGQRLPDGGIFMETSDNGFCPDTKSMVCLEGHCQRGECADLDGGCDYDLYGPSPFKGNRSQGPGQ